MDLCQYHPQYFVLVVDHHQLEKKSSLLVMSAVH